MPREDDEWDLNSRERVRDALAHQPKMLTNGTQAESGLDYGVAPARVPTTPECPDGRVPYA